MKRRRFSQMIAAGTAAMLAGPRMADAGDENQNQRDGPASFGRVRLEIGNQIIIPTRLLIISDNFSGAIGVDLKRDFPIQNENRSSLVNPTLGRRYRDSTQVAVVRQADRTLIIDTLPTPQLSNVFLLNGSTSYRINAGRLGGQVDTRLPALGNLPILGRVFRRGGSSAERNNLLILVTPTIIDDTM